MEFKEWFPEAVVNQDSYRGSDWISLPYKEEFIHLPVESLSMREQLLLALEKGSLYAAESDNEWYRYLVSQSAPLPIKLEAAQMVYVEHQSKGSEELADLFGELIPNLLTTVELTPTRTLLILNQEEPFDVSELLQDSLPVLESDIGAKLILFVGNRWSRLQLDDIRDYFTEENRIFTEFISKRGGKSSLSFSEMLLWATSRQLDITNLSKKILQLIEDTKDIKEIIDVMWKTHGNLVQTAQKLFMHRNSLQYKLDKFYQTSGFNLKNLDDLAIVYLLQLNDR